MLFPTINSTYAYVSRGFLQGPLYRISHPCCQELLSMGKPMVIILSLLYDKGDLKRI
jgi:hypothetical protein